MKYISTRGGISPIPFSQAVMMGLASDGGLILPERLPVLSRDEIKNLEDLSYNEVAFRIMSLFIDDIEPEDLKRLIENSYKTFDTKEVTPLIKKDGIYILELFHGPTLAFKDVALQFLGNLFSYLLSKDNSFMNILGATSGDTGSAAIYGVKGKKNINIFILHPHGRVSRMQALQMTTVQDKNCFNLAIEGTFDDCQAIVKTIFNDLSFKERYRLGAINSINWARVLAQVVYYVYAALKLKKEGIIDVVFSVPTGNFGDIFAGYVAKRLLGDLIRGLILATNENDILTRFVNEGIYRRGTVVQTISPSMDIQIASNFERYLFYLYGKDHQRVKEAMEEFEKSGEITFSNDEVREAQRDFSSYSITQKETMDLISGFYKETGYILDPHTAVGVGAAKKFLKERGNAQIICLATAHPCKFPEAVERAINRKPDMPDSMKALEGLPRRFEVLPPSIERVKGYIEEHALTSS